MKFSLKFDTIIHHTHTHTHMHWIQRIKFILNQKKNRQRPAESRVFKCLVLTIFHFFFFFFCVGIQLNSFFFTHTQIFIFIWIHFQFSMNEKKWKKKFFSHIWNKWMNEWMKMLYIWKTSSCIYSGSGGRYTQQWTHKWKKLIFLLYSLSWK